MDPSKRETCQELTPAKRNTYFSSQLLTERDFKEEQSYYRGKEKQHNRYLHGSGVVCGLRVVPSASAKPGWVVVEPGLALDPWGREIVVPESVQFELVEKRGPLFVVLEYRECPADWVPMGTEPPEAGSEGRMSPSRICESYQLDFRREPPEVGDPISRKLCNLVAEAIRQGMAAEGLHARLCELVSEPCRPCEPDPAVTLARIDLPASGAITAAHIDNWSHRHLALSADRLFQIVLGALDSRVR